MSDVQQPAGWYADPAGDATKLRYWDGKDWTEQLMDAAVSQASVATTTPYQPNATTPPYSADQSQPYGQQPYQTQYVQPVPVKDNSGLATAALILGIVGLPGGLLIPLLGYILGILAIAFGVRGRTSSKKNLGTAGLILGIVTLVLSCASHIIAIVLLQSFF